MSGFANKFSAYSTTQLNELLDDDEKLSKIVQEMDEMQEVQTTKEACLISNRTLAEQNLQLQPRLDQQKNNLVHRYRYLQELSEAYHLRKSTLDHHSSNGSLDTLLALLQAEGAKIEDETENMAESFLEGSISLDGFIDEYQCKRKLAHVRRVKIDKLKEMVLARPSYIAQTPPPVLPPKPVSQSGTPLPRRAPPPPPVQTTSMPTVLPFPPIPPRSGNTVPAPMPIYPSPVLAQYPPPVPQRSSPRLPPQPPQPGFIMH